MSLTSLRRFSFTVLKDKSSSDKAQVPTSATITFHPQGPILKDAFSWSQVLEEPATLHFALLYGDLQEGDQLSVASDSLSAGYLTVDSVAVNPFTRIATAEVYNSAPMTGQVGDRFVILNRPLACHSDPRGVGSGSTSIASNADTGRAATYLREDRFDFLVGITGLAIRAYWDAEGGEVTVWDKVVDASDFPSIQDAIDAVSGEGGGTVRIPAGKYTPDTTPAFLPPLVLPSSAPVRLLGDGPRRTLLWYSTLITTDHEADPTRDFIQIRGDRQSVEGLSLLGGMFSLGNKTGVGIRIRGADTTSMPLFGVVIRDCLIELMPSWGIYLSDEEPWTNNVQPISVKAQYDNVEVICSAGQGGIRIGSPLSSRQDRTTTQFFKNCHVRSAGTCAFE